MFLRKTILENNTLSLSRYIDGPDDNNWIEFADYECIVTIPEMDVYNGEYHLISRLEHNCFDFVQFKEIVIPKTITKIEWSFYECSSLESISVSKVNLHYCDVDGVLFDKDKKILVAFPNAKKDAYYIPEGTEIIDHFAFKTCKISELHIPSSVMRIEANAFYGCKKLKHIFFDNRTFADLRSICYSGFVSSEYGKSRVAPICHTMDKQMHLCDLDGILRK